MAAARKDGGVFNFAIVVLAAGASNRLGSPKQLLMYKGKSLLRHVLDIVAKVNAAPVIVVLGANSEKTSREVAGQNVYPVINENWKEGIASSIRCGINALERLAPLSEGAIFVVCDQPFITSSLLNRLIAVQIETGKPNVACSYDNTVGTPVLFSKTLFPELLALDGDSGAKKVIQKHIGSFSTTAFPRGNIDIDTKADYEGLESVGS